MKENDGLAKTKLPLAPPNKTQLIGELRAIWDLVRVPTALGKSYIKKSSGSKPEIPVILLPGFGGGERVMLPFQKFLCNAGFAAHGWGLGRNLAGLNMNYNPDELSWDYDTTRPNNGELGVAYLCDAMIPRVEDLYRTTGKPVALIGWSLGGCIAREVARDLPEAVRCVVTLGTPVHGGPKYTRAGNSLAKQGLDLDWIEQEVEKREARRITCPVTSIVSKNDGIVGYASTLDQRNKRVEHIEVNMSHLGMVFNEKAWRIALNAITNQI